MIFQIVFLGVVQMAKTSQVTGMMLNYKIKLIPEKKPKNPIKIESPIRISKY